MSGREIVLDTETTGMSPESGDKIVEIGCLELMNYIPTGKTLQIYLNPEREVPPEAIAIHGLTNEFLKDKPVFSQVYTDMLDFIGDARLVIHNAEFDMKFLNAELRNVGHPPLQWNRVVDTVAMARKKYPGQPANLDALCRRFGIDNTERTLHGALLDSELLAEVYMELLGGRQHGLLPVGADATGKTQAEQKLARPYREPRTFTASESEKAAHAEMLEKLVKPLWLKETG
ncbi:MAG: DNA polymerase III subunit epsilon [Alphaproteobacteria bacterium]